MAGKPKNFQAISNVLGNYNYVDILSGTGYINLYAGNTVDLKVLSNNTFYSNTIVESGTTSSAAYVALLDHDYDVILNRPLDLRGLGIINIGMWTDNTSSATAAYSYIETIVRKVTGGVESDIVANNSTEVAINSAGRWTELAIDVNIPLTHFKIGDTLRLTIKLWAKNTNADTTTAQYAHDPKNRTTGWDTSGAVPSQILFQCPVRLNL